MADTAFDAPTNRLTILNFAAESHVDRSIDGPRTFIDHEHRRHLRAPRGGPRSPIRLECCGAPATAFRFLHVSTDEVYGIARRDEGYFTEETPYAPNSPYSASKAAADHLVRAYHRDLWPAHRSIDQLLEQLRPLPVPREADPADDPERARGQGAPDLRRRRERPRLDLRRPTTATGIVACPRGRAARRAVRCSAATASARTSRWSTRSATCVERHRPASRATPPWSARGLDAYTLISRNSSRTARATTGATPSTRARSRRELDWRPVTPLRRGPRPRRCAWYLDNEWPGASRSRSRRRPPRPASDSLSRFELRNESTMSPDQGERISMKGILLAGGSGTRLAPGHPAGLEAAPAGLRQADGLLPALVADAGRDPEIILIISTPTDTAALRAPAGRRQPVRVWTSSTSHPGRSPTASPRPSSSAADWIGGTPSPSPSATTSSTGTGSRDAIRRAAQTTDGATVIGYHVHDPERYGVVEFDADGGNTLSIEEKPEKPKLELRGDRASISTTIRSSTFRSNLTPSARGELEITDVNLAYLEQRSN